MGSCKVTGIIQAVPDGNNLSALQRIALRSLWAVVGLVVVTYGADYCVFRYRVGEQQAYGSVAVEHFTAIEHKDGKAELIFDPSVQQSCVHSLFPHAGNVPCWFLSRHAQRETDI